MTSPIQLLHRLCKATFRSFLLRPDDPINFSEIKHHLNKITAGDVGFDPLAYRESELNKKKAPVSYIELYQDENSHTMAIFVVKEGGGLPLHDHPGMYGLLKVIYGKVRLTSYTETDSHPLPQHIPVQRQGANVKTVIRNPDVIATATSDCCSLSPKEGNFHEICPLTEFAAFLDILVPPYGLRGCHYFQGIQDPASHLQRSERMWLMETPEPKSYYCDVLPYKGPKLG